MIIVVFDLVSTITLEGLDSQHPYRINLTFKGYGPHNQDSHQNVGIIEPIGAFFTFHIIYQPLLNGLFKG